MFRKTAFSRQSESERIYEYKFRTLRVGVVIPSTLILTLHSVGWRQEKRNDNTHPQPSKLFLENSLTLADSEAKKPFCETL